MRHQRNSVVTCIRINTIQQKNSSNILVMKKLSSSYRMVIQNQSLKEQSTIHAEVLLQIKERPGLPNVVFKKLVTEGPSDLSRHVVGVPRDDEQVRNVQRVVARSKRISPDALHNMVLLQEELGIIGFHDDLVEKFRSIIDREDLPPQSLTYDTTFNLGDFYLSVLVFPETE